MPKIGLVVFSSNRLQYLEPVLESLALIDFDGFEVYRLLIDDFPKGRDPRRFHEIQKRHGFDEMILNEQITGYDKNIARAWQLLRAAGVDFIWHQEDDYKITKAIRMIDLVSLGMVGTAKRIVSVALKRPPWYPFEIEREKKFGPSWLFYNNDHSPRAYVLHNGLYLNPLDGKNWFYFMPTLYGPEIFNLAMDGQYPNEGTISYACSQKLGESYQVLYGALEEHHCEHIGEVSHGIKTSPGMPGFEYANSWAGGKPDPISDFDSRTGSKL